MALNYLCFVQSVLVLICIQAKLLTPSVIILPCFAVPATALVGRVLDPQIDCSFKMFLIRQKHLKQEVPTS